MLDRVDYEMIKSGGREIDYIMTEGEYSHVVRKTLVDRVLVS